MKLYYSPGACSLASHIILREAGFTFEIDRVDSNKKTSSGEDFRQINPKGYVPALRLDGGEVLTEGAAILQYLADQRPAANLAPPAGTLERARLQEYLNYTASELHKAFGPLFSPATPEAVKQACIAKAQHCLGYIESQLVDERPYLLGKTFTVADAYLFVVASWSSHVGVNLEPFPRLKAFVQRVASREKVQEAMRAEGLTA